MSRTRRRARTRLDTRPYRSVAVLVVVLGIAVAVPLLTWHGARKIIASNEGSVVTTTTVADKRPLVQLPATPVGLLVLVGPASRASGFVVLSEFPKGQGGFVIQLPTDLRADIPGQGPGRLATAYDTGGLELAKQTVSSLLQVAIDVAAEADPAKLPVLLAPYEPFELTFDQAVMTTGPNGQQVRLFGAGDVSISAMDVPKLLAARSRGQSDIDVLPREQQLWRAVVAAVKVKAGTLHPDTTSIEGFLAGLGQGTHVTTAVAFDPSFRPDGVAGVPAEPIRTRYLVAQAMPGAFSPSSDNARYRIVNTTGDPRVALALLKRVSANGANFVAVGDTAGPLATTIVEYTQDANKQLAQNITHVLGAGSAQRAAQIVQGIDITITVGVDFAKVVADERARAEATTTTTIEATTTTTTKRRAKG